MKINAVKLILSIFGVVFLLACRNKPEKQSEKLKEEEIIRVSTAINTDKAYSDSMRQAMIRAQSPKTEQDLSILDSLQNKDCAALDLGEHNLWNMASVDQYEAQLQQKRKTTGLEELSKMCLVQLSETNIYEAKIFYRNDNLSHYSGSIELETFDTQGDKIWQVILAVSYGNEQKQSTTSTVFTSDSSFTQTKFHEYHYIHGIGPIDSLETTIMHYVISNEGKVLKKSQSDDVRQSNLGN